MALPLYNGTGKIGAPEWNASITQGNDTEAEVAKTASTTQLGRVELATNTETRNGTTGSGTAGPLVVTPSAAKAVFLQFVALGGVTLSGQLAVAPDSATYTAWSGKQTGDIVATLAP